MSLNIAAGLVLAGNETYPDLLQPCCGFLDGVHVIDVHDTMPDPSASASKGSRISAPG